MSEVEEFRSLMRRVHAGDAEAAAAIVRTYEAQIRRSARLRLTDPSLRRFLDSVDICQSVFLKFFVGTALGKFELDSPQQLVGLLAKMARNRVIHHVRMQKAAKRGGEEKPLGQKAVEAAACKSPSPDKEVATRELFGRCLELLPEEHRYLLEQRNLGREWAELAAEMGVTPDQLRMRHNRAVKKVQKDLGLEDDDDDD